MMPVAANRTNRQRPAIRTAGLVAVLVIAGIAAGCKHGRKEVAGYTLADPSQRHPIIVSQREVVLDVAAPRGAYGLSKNQKLDVRDFVRRYRQDGEGVLVVQTPTGGANEVAAVRAMEDVRGVLRHEHLARRQVVFEPYYGNPGEDAPLRISFMRYVADAPECGYAWENLAKDRKNMNYRNFGCSAQRNLAAMVANPRDLVEARGQTPRSSERRDVTWEKYVKGETTVSEKADEEKSNVSEVSGGGSGK